MSHISRDDLSDPAARFLISSSPSKDYGSFEKIPSQQPQKGNFDGTSIAEEAPAKIPSWLHILGNPVQTVVVMTKAAQRLIQNVAENPAEERLRLSNQLKQEWKNSYVSSFAAKCAHSRKVNISSTASAPSKAQLILYYDVAEAACENIINNIAEEAAKYESVAGKPEPLKKAADNFKAFQIAEKTLAKALEKHAASFVEFDESAFTQQGGEALATAVSSAIHEATELMGAHWLRILNHIDQSN